MGVWRTVVPFIGGGKAQTVKQVFTSAGGHKVAISLVEMIRVAANIWLSSLRALVVSIWKREIYHN